MKTFRTFKRARTGGELPETAPGYKERPYYCRFEYLGQVYVRCLKTTEAAEAQRRARLRYAEITDLVNRGEFKSLSRTKLRTQQTATLETLRAAYLVGPSEAGAKTRALNLNALAQIAAVKAATKVCDLTPALIRHWFETVTTAVLAEPDQQKSSSLKRSANSRWAQARSIFTPKCLEHYRDKGIYHETMEAFVRAGDLAAFTRIPKIAYNPPSESIITATLAAWEQLALNPQPSSRDLFLAIGHELAFGLRIGELEQARWNWHTERNGYPVLDATANVKNGTGRLRVRALDPWFTSMKRHATANGWWPDLTLNPQPSTLIIEGTATYRTDDLYRAVSAWLRSHGWETKKTNHALRAYTGSQVAMKYGIYDAQMWLRHSTVKVTEQNYAHFVDDFKPADLETIPCRYAVTRPEFVPQFVHSTA